VFGVTRNTAPLSKMRIANHPRSARSTPGARLASRSQAPPGNALSGRLCLALTAHPAKPTLPPSPLPAGAWEREKRWKTTSQATSSHRLFRVRPVTLGRIRQSRWTQEAPFTKAKRTSRSESRYVNRAQSQSDPRRPSPPRRGQTSRTDAQRPTIRRQLRTGLRLVPAAS
jgi:hypothetical protein